MSIMSVAPTCRANRSDAGHRSYARACIMPQEARQADVQKTPSTHTHAHRHAHDLCGTYAYACMHAKTHLVGDFAHARVVDVARVGGGAHHDQLGAAEQTMERKTNRAVLRVNLFWGCNSAGRACVCTALRCVPVEDRVGLEGVVVDEPGLFVQAVRQHLKILGHLFEIDR